MDRKKKQKTEKRAAAGGPGPLTETMLIPFEANARLLFTHNCLVSSVVAAAEQDGRPGDEKRPSKREQANRTSSRRVQEEVPHAVCLFCSKDERVHTGTHPGTHLHTT